MPRRQQLVDPWGFLDGQQKFDPTAIILDDPELWRDRLNRYHLRNVDLRKTDRYIMIGVALIGALLMQHGGVDKPRLDGMIGSLERAQASVLNGNVRERLLLDKIRGESKGWYSAVRKAINVLRRQ